MDQGQIELTKLGDHLKGVAFVRACLVKQSTAWCVLYMDALIGSEPPLHQGDKWVYDGVSFISFSLPGEQLVVALANGDGAELGADGLTFAFPQLQSLAQWQRHPSYGPRYDWYISHLPTTTYKVFAANVGNRQLRPSKLVGDGPSFSDSRIGLNAFFTGDYTNSRDLTTEVVNIRCADTSAWLGPIHITATKLTVDVCGAEVRGATLELFSESDRESIEVPQAGNHEFLLPDGPLTHLWVWLKRGTDWLDYRAITPWTSETDLTAANVKIDVPNETQTMRISHEAIYQALYPAIDRVGLDLERRRPWRAQPAHCRSAAVPPPQPPRRARSRRRRRRGADGCQRAGWGRWVVPPCDRSRARRP
jgi:hypothetical protein